MLARVNITTVAELRAANAFQIYAELYQHYPRLSLNMLYALIGAQENRPWLDVARTRKTEILLQLESLGITP